MPPIKEKRVLTTRQDIVDFGKIISNKIKLNMIAELAHGDLPKSKLADLIGVSPGTINKYAGQLLDLGIVQQYVLLKGTYPVRVLTLRVSKVNIEFYRLKQQTGWRNAKIQHGRAVQESSQEARANIEGTVHGQEDDGVRDS